MDHLAEYFPTPPSRTIGSSTEYTYSPTAPLRPAKSTRRLPSDRAAPNSLPSSYEYEVEDRESGDDSFELEQMRRAVQENWPRRREVDDSSVASEARFQGNAEASTSQSVNHWVSQHDSKASIQDHTPEYHHLHELAKGKRRKVDARGGEWRSRGSIDTIDSYASGETIYEDATEAFDYDSEGLDVQNEVADARTPLSILLPSPLLRHSSPRKASGSRGASKDGQFSLHSMGPNPNHRDLTLSPTLTSTSTHASTLSCSSPKVLPATASGKAYLTHNGHTPSLQAQEDDSSYPTQSSPKRSALERGAPSANYDLQSSPLLPTPPLFSTRTHKNSNANGRNWVPKPLVLIPARAKSPSPRLGSPASPRIPRSPSQPLSPTYSYRRRERRGSNSPPSRPTSPIGYIDSTSVGAPVKRRSIGYFEAGITAVLDGRSRDSTLSSSSGYGLGRKRSGSDYGEGDEESPNSSFGISEADEDEQDSEQSKSWSTLDAKRKSELFAVQEEDAGGLRKVKRLSPEYHDSSPTPMINLSGPSPSQPSDVKSTARSHPSHAISHSLSTLNGHSESSPHDPPTPPPSFPLPVLPQDQKAGPRYPHSYSTFLNARGELRSEQGSSVYDAYWEAAPADRLNKSVSSSFSSDDDETAESRVIHSHFISASNGDAGALLLAGANAQSRRSAHNRVTTSPPSSHSSFSADSTPSSPNSSRYGNAMEEILEEMEELSPGLAARVPLIFKAQEHDHTPGTITFRTLAGGSTFPAPQAAFKGPRQETSSPKAKTGPMAEPRVGFQDNKSSVGVWPPLNDGRTRVLSLSPRLSTADLDYENTPPPPTTTALNSSVDPLSASTSSSRASKRFSWGGIQSREGRAGNDRSDPMRLFMCGQGKVFEDNEDLDQHDRSMESAKSVASNPRSMDQPSNSFAGKRFGMGTKKFIDFAKSSITSSKRSRPASPSPLTTPTIMGTEWASTNSSPAISVSRSAGQPIAQQYRLQQPPIESTVPSSSFVRRMMETDTSSEDLQSWERLSISSSLSERRLPPKPYQVPPGLSWRNKEEQSLPPLPPTVRIRRHPSSSGSFPPKMPSPTTLAVAQALYHGPPSPRGTPVSFTFPAHAPRSTPSFKLVSNGSGLSAPIQLVPTLVPAPPTGKKSPFSTPAKSLFSTNKNKKSDRTVVPVEVKRKGNL